MDLKSRLVNVIFPFVAMCVVAVMVTSCRVNSHTSDGNAPIAERNERKFGKVGGPQASPSMPSVRLTALTKPVMMFCRL